MCNEVKFDINLKLTKFALKWVLTWRDSFIFKYCNHGKYVKFHLKMKRLHPRAGPSSRHMAISNPLYLISLNSPWQWKIRLLMVIYNSVSMKYSPERIRQVSPKSVLSKKKKNLTKACLTLWDPNYTFDGEMVM